LLSKLDSEMKTQHKLAWEPNPKFLDKKYHSSKPSKTHV
jgi:hypothetical protein